MAAAPADPSACGGGIAQVTFRVRCETLGHGESVFLSQADNPAGTRVPLLTTAKSYPWYTTRSPLSLPFPKTPNSTNIYRYRYAIHRAGIFHRWEDPSDGGDVEELRGHQTTIGGTPSAAEVHSVPMRLLQPGELYAVNDVLGVTSGPPDIDHVKVRKTFSSVGSLARRTNSVNSLYGPNASRSNSASAMSDAGTKKKVGFAPQPPALGHRAGAGSAPKQAVHLTSSDGLIVVSAFLPVHLTRSDNGEWSADWDYEALLSMQTHLRVTRVGTVKWRGWHGNVGGGKSDESGVPVDERLRVEAVLRPFNCVPVWVPTTLFGEMYNGFCKGVLWPILHNVASVYSSPTGVNTGRAPNDEVSKEIEPYDSHFAEYSMDDEARGPIHGDGGREGELWAAFTAVNRHFKEVIIQCFNEGDLIWIHGFHLMILPSFLTRHISMAKIGIFLHTPFPSSEIFRTLWCREDLLRGMLNADQVGFHLFEYARHFLTCCRRLLGLNYGMFPDSSGGHNLAIDTNGRHVSVTSIHAGVEPPVLHQVLGHVSTRDRVASIRDQFRGKVIFAAIDRMESLKGIPLKLIALERFLQRCPEWAGRIVVVQVGISAFERGDDYTETRSEIMSMVANINGRWPGTVQFQECAESEMRLQQRMALLRAADVVMVTTIRDGLNLIPLEFTIAHLDALTEQGRNDGRKRGLCILSEFSSCTRVMRGALHVNPWKISEIATAFFQALTMSEDERMRRISIASEFVTRVTTQRWALAVMLDLKGVQKNEDAGRYAGAGLGLGFRLLGMDSKFNQLDANSVARAYRSAKSRLILLDYGGTILVNDNLDQLQRFQFVKKSRPPSVPTEGLISTLKELCSDQRNVVFVVSGKERHSLTKTLCHIPNLGLAAEHGMFVSWPTPKVGGKRRWETLVPDQDRSWRSIATMIMEVYTSRTHGSYIEETEMKVLWQYRDADPEFGYLQSRELEDHLSNVLRGFAVDILHGGVEEGGYVEVRPKGVNKGVVSMHIVKNLEKISDRGKLEFALVIGDDHCDEPMLSVMRQIGRRASEARVANKGGQPLAPLPATIAQVDVTSCDDYISSHLQCFTSTVGKKPSAAANYLNDVEDVQELLESLVKVTTRETVHSGYYSVVDLKKMEAPASPTPLVPLAVSTYDAKSSWQRSLSMGQLHIPANPEAEQTNETGANANWDDYLGTMNEGEEDEEDIFF
eukprot:CAMPEP_0172526174 /NCGR_PEP_ID=MMETSP1067-20121228/1140_1 /TAXON_ID=265564 ORGANISM="Thalassiosira punctigera, Strain Tpunct2005C2" /NCGR_SAMPLE_ID=MMETSP1067 /ASSEMBLY_ACC=CAM_ASM_000444 /LENGTH=1201 /DNA_ID=CAMNT_0013309623 /DNA_START=51 /DNA_END=3656 /DNA_ORIENTATION=-